MGVKCSIAFWNRSRFQLGMSHESFVNEDWTRVVARLGGSRSTGWLCRGRIGACLDGLGRGAGDGVFVPISGRRRKSSATASIPDSNTPNRSKRGEGGGHPSGGRGSTRLLRRLPDHTPQTIASVIITYAQGLWRMALVDYGRPSFERQIAAFPDWDFSRLRSQTNRSGLPPRSSPSSFN